MNRKLTIGASVTDEMKERVKRLAKQKYWSVGQTLGLFIDRYWEEWEKELGVETQTTPKKPRKTANKPEK